MLINTFLNDIQALPLWQEFLSKVQQETNAAEKQARIEHLISQAAARLDRVVETFPTYTLHNRIHASNLVRLMSELLDDCVHNLTALEAAMLLLSAYIHDIGMVFTEDERANLQTEEWFEEFLKTYPAAYLEMQKAQTLTPFIAEWYCRWRHAERVSLYLNQLSDAELSWGTVCFREELANLCRSHNLNAHDLKNDSNFDTNYLYECDLRFCGILLRLADILDFDNSRSPDEVYQYLGLSQRATKREEISDVEWLKHLHSDGFRFPPQRTPEYKLGFLSGPDEPSVEHDIREFLNIIENELNVCRSVQAHCSDKWRGCPMPGEIDRSQIKSRGYVYGEYRFTLDQNQVLDLFMGENLYSQPYVFVRELLQNALDTSRHRQFYERSNGNADFEAQPINVTEWADSEGYQWMRIDDYGMGMTTTQIQKYLLKVGSSYYRSPEFEAEKIRYTQKHQGDFTPISRFGVGLLSCFSVCDTVEISTRHVICKPGSEQQPVRLSLTGTRQFFTLQTGQNIRPKLMPAERNSKIEFRREAGTSIAVRLDPKKESGIFQLRDLLESYLLCPPVPVMFEDQLIGGYLTDLTGTPWMLEPVTTTVSCEDMQKFEETLDYKFDSPLQITLLPLNITEHSPTSELQGQMIIGFVHTSDSPSRLAVLPTPTGQSSIHRHLILSVEDDNNIFLSAKYDSNQKHKEVKRQFNLLSKATIDKIEMVQNAPSWMSHNGIAVNDDYRTTRINQKHKFVFHNLIATDAPEYVLGFLALADTLGPDLAVSRDTINTLPWSFYSALYLGVVRAIQEQSPNSLAHAIRLSQLPLLVRDRSLGMLLNDPLLNCENGWKDQPIFDGFSITAFLDQKKTNKFVVQSITGRDFWSLYRACLLRTHCQLVCRIEHNLLFTEVTDGEPLPILDGEKIFPPLFFAPYADCDYLQFSVFDPVNINHPFAKWLVDVAVKLRHFHPAIFNSIIDTFTSLPRVFDINAYQIEQVNSALERLRGLPLSDEKLRPPKTISLKPEDFR